MKEKEDVEIEEEKDNDVDVEKVDEGVLEKDVIDVTSSQETRKEKMQTPIPSPTRSPGYVSSSDKTISEELTATVSPTTATTSNSHIQNKFVTQEFFMEKMKEGLHHCNTVVPELTVAKTNEMIKEEMPRLVKLAVDKDREISPVDISDMHLTNDYDVIDDFGGPKDLEELLINDDLNRDLGNFLEDNDLLPNFDARKDISLSLVRSPIINSDPFGEFHESGSNIAIDDFIEIDDLWDNLDPGTLTNDIVNPPLKPEFFSEGNRVHRHNPYNIQITCKIWFVNFNPYINPHSPFNIMSRATYNSVMKQDLVYTGNNMVGMAKNLNVFVRHF
ncbi:hypothetical protein Tco_0845615 [Tanacetum coccineum]